MFRVVSILLLFVMSIATALAVAPLQEKETYPDGIPRITIEDLKTKLDKKEGVIIVDVRGHVGTIIKGALHIPLAEIEKNLDKLPKDKLIVAVCSCSSEGSSGAAVRILMGKGYTKAFALKGGQIAWEAAKYPTEVVPENK